MCLRPFLLSFSMLWLSSTHWVWYRSAPDLRGEDVLKPGKAIFCSRTARAASAAWQRGTNTGGPSCTMTFGWHVHVQASPLSGWGRLHDGAQTMWAGSWTLILELVGFPVPNQFGLSREGQVGYLKWSGNKPVRFLLDWWNVCRHEDTRGAS